MSESGILGAVIEKFVSPLINLSPLPVLHDDGSERLPALDNHSMGTVFEELIRRFNEENNEEAGEHFTPRDVVELMADLMLRRGQRHGRHAHRGGRTPARSGGKTG